MIYYARHRRLWTTSATSFTEQPHFATVEARFFERAEQLFGPVKAAPKPRPKKANAKERSAASAARPKRTSPFTDRPRNSHKGKPARERPRAIAPSSAARGRKR